MKLESIFLESENEEAKLVAAKLNPGEVSLPAKLLWFDGLKRFVERLLKKVKANENGCWIWTAAKDWDGYGSTYGFQTQMRAPKMFYFIWKGVVPEGLFVCHKCDTPSCVNPNHLFLGTAKENNHECLNKGRHSCGRGSRNGSAKLSEAQVEEIRNKYRPYSRDGFNMYNLAIHYGVSPTQIHAVIHRKNWK